MNAQEILSRLIRFLIIALAGSVALAGTRDPNTPDEKYIEFGKQFPNVVRIRTKTAIEDKETGITVNIDQYGSAVLIRPHWALTAAHVLHDTKEPEILISDNKKHKIPYFVVHGDFKSGKFGHADVALCYSADDFAAEFYPELYTDDDELGKNVTFAGYGVHGTFATGFTDSDGLRRAGHNKIESCSETSLFCSPTSGPGRLPLEFMITPGDSGGGMFIGNKLAGINSFLTASDKKPDGTYGDESAFTRVSLYVNWINEQIEKHELFIQGRSTTGAVLP